MHAALLVLVALARIRTSYSYDVAVFKYRRGPAMQRLSVFMVTEAKEYKVPTAAGGGRCPYRRPL